MLTVKNSHEAEKSSKRKFRKYHPHFCPWDVDIAFEENASPNESVLITEDIFGQRISEHTSCELYLEFAFWLELPVGCDLRLKHNSSGLSGICEILHPASPSPLLAFPGPFPILLSYPHPPARFPSIFQDSADFGLITSHLWSSDFQPQGEGVGPSCLCVPSLHPHSLPMPHLLWAIF